jgi:hypothetical protein
MPGQSNMPLTNSTECLRVLSEVIRTLLRVGVWGFRTQLRLLKILSDVDVLKDCSKDDARNYLRLSALVRSGKKFVVVCEAYLIDVFAARQEWQEDYGLKKMYGEEQFYPYECPCKDPKRAAYFLFEGLKEFASKMRCQIERRILNILNNDRRSLDILIKRKDACSNLVTLDFALNRILDKIQEAHGELKLVGASKKFEEQWREETRRAGTPDPWDMAFEFYCEMQQDVLEKLMMMDRFLDGEVFSSETKGYGMAGSRRRDESPDLTVWRMGAEQQVATIGEPFNFEEHWKFVSEIGVEDRMNPIADRIGHDRSMYRRQKSGQ